MKTDTRLRIVKLLEKNGEMRPADFVKALAISPQALHRHLKVLLTEGKAESRGKPPVTRYALAGVPDFSRAFGWYSAARATDNPNEFICQTRDTFYGRQSHLKELVKRGLPPEDLPLLISVVGEVGNNSFDHNLGHWKDIPGCWFEFQWTGRKAWICIADRGRGILSSLRNVMPDLKTEQQSLEIAFERSLSGRAPEKRGNGLKFVKHIVLQQSNRGLGCVSADGMVTFGVDAEKCKAPLGKLRRRGSGVLTLITWGCQ